MATLTISSTRQVHDVVAKRWRLSRLKVSPGTDPFLVQWPAPVMRVATSSLADGAATWESAPTWTNGQTGIITYGANGIDGYLYVWDTGNFRGPATALSISSGSIRDDTRQERRMVHSRTKTKGTGWLGNVHYRLPFTNVDDDDIWTVPTAFTAAANGGIQEFAWEAATSTDTCRPASVTNTEIRFLTGGASGISGFLHLWYKGRPRATGTAF